MVSLASKRHLSSDLSYRYQVSERRVCKLIWLSRATRRYISKHDQARDLRADIHRLSQRYPRFGYRKIYDKLRAEGWRVGKERVRLIRKQEGLQVIRKSRRKRLLGRSTTELRKATYPNQVWSYDLVADQTACGRRFRCLTVIDEYTRYGLAIHVNRSITSGQVKRVLQQLFAQWGTPACIKSDNGPEFIAKEIQTWLEKSGVATRYIDPGSPWQNGHNESFNGVFRDGCLDRWYFYSVQEASRVIMAWLDEYNIERPHGALDGLTPARYVEQCRENKRLAA